jgi:RNA 2',3'-cyclic 3'-phosphodiesterase
MHMGRMRVFFALWPDENARERLAEHARDFANAHGGNPVSADKIHLTLVFVGAVEPVRLDALRAAGAGIQGSPPCLRFERITCRSRSQIVWAEPLFSPLDLERLVAGLRERLAAAGFLLERRRFKPHITLVRRAQCRNDIHEIPSIDWKAESFVLLHSRLSSAGSAYEPLGNWALDSAH